MTDETQGATQTAPAVATIEPANPGTPITPAAPVNGAGETAAATGGAGGTPEPKPAAEPETFLERMEDDIVKAAEDAAYAMSNLFAESRGRKKYDGIEDWKTRTGGLHRHADAKPAAGANAAA